MSKTPTFRASNGLYYTKQLFWEMADPSADRPYVLYSLKDEDHEVDGVVYPSIKRLYVEFEDETEYEFAKRYFQNYSQFKKLLDATWFRIVIEDAREELKLKLAARALTTVKQKASEGDLRANQLLLSSWVDSKKSKAGRPSKAQIKQEAEDLFRQQSSVRDDHERIFGSVNPVGPGSNLN